MSKSKKLFVFDFDGVVCDSTDECMVTSWNAWQRWNGKNHFRTTLEEFTDREIDEFRPLRYYVRGAGEYYILRRLLSETNIKLIKRYEDFEIYQKNPMVGDMKAVFTIRCHMSHVNLSVTKSILWQNNSCVTQQVLLDAK